MPDPGKKLKTAQELAKRSDIKEVVVIPSGRKGDWAREINPGKTGTLLPEKAFVLDNGHAYITDSSGRVKEVSAELLDTTMARNRYQQGCAAAKGCAGDDGGHLIAASLGGAGDGINIVPQSSTLNREDWKAMETYLRKQLNEGKTVSVKINVGYSDANNSRPNKFSVQAIIDGEPWERSFNQ